jgi:hypothetical protein
VNGLSATEIAIAAAYMTFMMLVCMPSCIVPTRRALRDEPTEALRADGEQTSPVKAGSHELRD